jgi:hypothetical protein
VIPTVSHRNELYVLSISQIFSKIIKSGYLDPVYVSKTGMGTLNRIQFRYNVHFLTFLCCITVTVLILKLSVSQSMRRVPLMGLYGRLCET